MDDTAGGTPEFRSLNHAETIFRSGMGHKATVQRETLAGEKGTGINRMLIDLGMKAQEVDPALKSLTYCGSAAVHVYYSHILGQMFFVSQTQPLHLYHCPELLAKQAFDDLLGELKRSYGHKRGKLRSGW